MATRLASAAILILACAPAAAHNGYSFSRTGGGQFTGTRVSLLDPENSEIAKFANGVSVTLWIRFNDLTPSRIQMPLAINTEFQDNLFQAFGGVHGGFFFGGSGPSAVADLGDAAKDWHHYAFTWDDAGSGDVKVYVDGNLVSEQNQKLVSGDVKVNWWQKNAYVIVGASGYWAKWMLNEPHSVNSDYSIDGEVDDVAVYAKVLSPTEIDAMRTSTSQADGAAADSDLILFWDFNDGPNEGVVPNKGRAGSDYDLLMGQLPKPDFVPAGSESRTMLDDVAVGMAALESAFIIPGSVPKNVSDTTAPLVLTASAGETVSSSEYGFEWFEWTAPNPFNEIYVDTSGAVTVHVVPKKPPTGASAAYIKKSGREDTPMNLHLWGGCEWADGSSLVPKIKVLPAGGDLYVIDFKTSTELTNKIETVGDLVTSFGRYVRYVPNLNAASASAGELYDTIVYSLVVDGVEGATTSLEIVLQSVNDLPAVTDKTITLDEDEYPAGLAVPLEATDSDQDILYKDYLPTVSITSFPSKGDLYHTTDGTAEGKYGDPIRKGYSHFDVGGDVRSAAPTENLNVSSFWGNPPNADYHPLNMLGNQSCFTYGECPNEQPWVQDPTAYPFPGSHVRHQATGASSPLVARVVSTDETAGTVTIEYLKMYKVKDGEGYKAPSGKDGEYVQCHIQMSNSTMDYPGDCDHTIIPASGAVVATIDRGELLGTSGDNWCPLQKGYGGPNNLKTGAGAFGVQNAFSHQQADTYVTAGYTEYIELRIPTPTYVVMVEFGASRGMGAIVGVKAKSPDGEWVALYKGKALVGDSIRYKELSSYWKWAPPSVCRTHFKATDFRVELDTSTETGVDDWNEYDYMKVYGSQTLQPAVLPYGQSSIIYVPHKDAHGTDSFTYSASDCTGNLFRSSKPSTVSLMINPVNDAPVAQGDTLSVTTSEGRKKIDLGALISDVESFNQHETWHQGRRLALTDLSAPTTSPPASPPSDACANVCRSHSCGFFYGIFTCQELDAISCSCSSCCVTQMSPPPPPSAPPPPSQPPPIISIRIISLPSVGNLWDSGNKIETVPHTVTSSDRVVEFSIPTLEGIDLTLLNATIIGYRDVVYTSLRYSVADPEGLEATAEVSLAITSSALKCPSGFTLTLKGLGVTCGPCPFGSYEFENLLCNKVDPAHYMPFEGKDEKAKLPCPEKTRVSETFVEQTTREVSVAVRSGGIAEEECTCIRGTYAEDVTVKPPVCLGQIQGSVAIGGTFIPIAAQGYGKISQESGNFYQCKGFQRCPGPKCDCLGGINEMRLTDNGSEPVSVSFRCNEGYLQESPLCSLCDTDNGYALSLGECSKCEMPEIAYPLIAIALVVGWFAIGGWLSEKLETLEVLFGMVGFFGLYSDFSIEWGDEFSSFFSSCSFFNMDVDFIHISCFTKMSYSTLWSIQTFLPLFYIFYSIVDIVLSFILSHMARWPEFPPLRLMLELGWRPRISFSFEALVSFYLPKGMLYMHMYYLTGVPKTIEMYSCTEGSDGEVFLSASPAIPCWEGEHLTLAILNAVAFFVYLIATPLFYVYVLFVLVPRHGLSDRRLNANFGFVWSRFEEKFYWWETVEMVRKLGLCLVQVLATDPIIQTNCAVVICGFMLVVNLLYRPYVKFRYDVYDAVCSMVQVAILLSGNLVYHRRLNPDQVSEYGPEFIAVLVLTVGAVFSAFNILIDLRDLVWEYKLSALRVRVGLRMSGLLEVSPQLLAFLNASDKVRVADMRKFEGMLMKAAVTYTAKVAAAKRERYRAMFEVEPALLDWLLMPGRKGKEGPLCKFVNLLMDDKKELSKGTTNFSNLIETKGPNAPLLALWLSEVATTQERDLITRLNADLVTFEKEDWMPSFADKFHGVDKLPHAFCEMIVSCFRSILSCMMLKFVDTPKIVDNGVDDFSRIKGSMLTLAKNEQFQLQSELERVLHDLQLRLNGQAIMIMPAPIKENANAMPTKKPKLELLREVVTSSGEVYKQDILGSNDLVDWSLGINVGGNGSEPTEASVQKKNSSQRRHDSPSSVCYKTGKIVVVKNRLLDKRFRRGKSNKGHVEVFSQLCVPLISEDSSVLGVLCAINKVPYSGGSTGIPFSDADIEDAELYAAMLVETFEGFTRRAVARKAIGVFEKKGMGGFSKGGLIAATKTAHAKMEADGVLGDNCPVRAAFAAEKAAQERSEVTINIAQKNSSSIEV